MATISFEDFVEFIQDFWPLKPKGGVIRPETQFERDLDLTGDDGDDLLEAVQNHFHIQFTAETFNLKSNEALFHDEASILFLSRCAKDELLMRDPLRATREYRVLTVGELYEAALRELDKSSHAN